jgi:RNA polymerase sigma-70 factor (ECF subfamily)
LDLLWYEKAEVEKCLSPRFLQQGVAFGVGWIMDLSETTDLDLVQEIGGGNTQSFQVLMDRYKNPIYQMAYRMILDPFESEDLLQVVFLQVYRNLSTFKPQGSFKAWIFTIARNTCLNEIRRRRRKPVRSLDEMTSDSQKVPFQVVDHEQQSAHQIILQDELVEILSRILQEVPEKQRTALLLYQQENLSYEEISKILGCSIGATKSLIFRAREHLKVRLRPYLNEGAWTPAVFL